MIELIQFSWSPFCLVQKRILEFAAVRFKLVSIPINDRSMVWRLTKGRYYQVPILRHGRNILFETSEVSQVLAKYLDETLHLGLFPFDAAGIQSILWRYIEGSIEEVGFKLNDVYYQEYVPKADQVGFIRHKERKFGRGCLDLWKRTQEELLDELERRLIPLDQMLAHRPFLLDSEPRFVDFDLYGMLANFLYSGHYELPKVHENLRAWYQRISTVQRPGRAISPQAR
jgi:glutathione S-transferase